MILLSADNNKIARSQTVETTNTKLLAIQRIAKNRRRRCQKVNAAAAAAKPRHGYPDLPRAVVYEMTSQRGKRELLSGLHSVEFGGPTG